MPTEEKQAAKLCSKCKKNPRAAEDSSNPWCTECLAEYMAEYRKKGEWRAERRGLIRGIQAAKEDAALYFGQYAGRPFMGAEVASILRALPGPSVADESAVKAQ